MSTCRPHMARIHGEQRLVDALRSEAPHRGMRKAVAQDLAVSESFISQMVKGKRHITPKVAEHLGFALAWVPIKDLK